MVKDKRTFSTPVICILSFLLTFIVFHVTCLILGLGIYGDRTVLKWDATNIYINCYAYLWDILKGNTKEIFYTLSITPGNGNSLILGWFLCSPFNLLILLFDKSTLPDAYFWIECLKLSTAGLTMAVFLTRLAKRKQRELSLKNAIIITLLSLGYSFGGFVAAHVHELLYFDAILILPLVADGLWKICSEGKVLQYYLCLFYAISTNFYFGFMICIFCTLFFLYLCIRNKSLKGFARFAISSILAAGTSAIILFPVLYQIPQSKLAGENASVFNLGKLLFEICVIIFVLVLICTVHRLFSSTFYKEHVKGIVRFFVDAAIIFCVFIAVHVLFNKLAWKGDYLGDNILMPLRMFSGVFRIDDYQPKGLMNIYSGVLVTIGIVMFFCDYRVDTRKKLLDFEALALCFLMMGFRQTNLVWHGFTYPAGSFYRWAFFISFFLVFLVAEYLLDLSTLGAFSLDRVFKEQASYVYLLVMLCLGVLSLHKYKQSGYGFLDSMTIILNIVLIAVLLVICVCGRKRGQVWLLSIIVIGGEIINNAYVSNKDFEHTSYAQYKSYLDTSEQIMNDLESDSDGSEYRVESEYQQQWWYISGYNSIYHLGSAYTSKNSKFMQNFGMGVDDDVHGKAALNNFDLAPELAGFLGIKYLISSKKLEAQQYSLFRTYKDEWSGEDYYVYYNPKCMPLVFRVPTFYQNTNEVDTSILSKLADGYSLKNGETGLIAVGPSEYVATVDCDDNESIAWTLPYNEGWNIYVDGTKTDAKKMMGFLMAVDVSPGVHELRMKYAPPFLLLGGIVSVISLIMFLFMYVFIFRRYESKGGNWRNC